MFLFICLRQYDPSVGPGPGLYMGWQISLSVCFSQDSGKISNRPLGPPSPQTWKGEVAFPFSSGLPPQKVERESRCTLPTAPNPPSPQNGKVKSPFRGTL